jgi:hypothetical protein
MKTFGWVLLLLSSTYAMAATKMTVDQLNRRSRK